MTKKMIAGLIAVTMIIVILLSACYEKKVYEVEGYEVGESTLTCFG